MTTPDWLAGYPITGTWAAHLGWGSLGGVDYGMPVGTPLLAPSAGRLTFYVYKDGSSCARVEREDGTATEFLHGTPVGGARTVAEGEHIANSGGAKGSWGAGPSTGPHLHAHDLTAAGTRVEPFSTIPDTIITEEDTDMKVIHHIMGKNQAYYLAGPFGVKLAKEVGDVDVLRSVYGTVTVRDEPLDAIVAATAWNRSLAPAGTVELTELSVTMTGKAQIE